MVWAYFGDLKARLLGDEEIPFPLVLKYFGHFKGEDMLQYSLRLFLVEGLRIPKITGSFGWNFPEAKKIPGQPWTVRKGEVKQILEREESKASLGFA